MNTLIDRIVIDRVIEKRKERGMSQLALACELDVSAGFIGRVESKNYPAKYNLSHLAVLAEIFDCNMKDFLPDSLPKQKQ